jgi:hypothetical protein
MAVLPVRFSHKPFTAKPALRVLKPSSTMRKRVSTTEPEIRFPFLNTRLKLSLPLSIALLGRVLLRFAVLLGWSCIAYGQAMTSFGTAALEDFATICSFHSGTKTVLVSALAATWLIRAFHGFILSKSLVSSNK